MLSLPTNSFCLLNSLYISLNLRSASFISASTKLKYSSSENDFNVFLKELISFWYSVILSEVNPPSTLPILEISFDNLLTSSMTSFTSSPTPKKVNPKSILRKSKSLVCNFPTSSYNLSI